MAFLKFNKSELVNLSYSLKREIISANKTGAYCNTSIVTCNTRRYHGLLAVMLDRFGGDKFMLLSSLDESLIVDGKQFNLGIHRYGDVYEPRGHKYVIDFQENPIPQITYKVGDIVFTKSILLVPDNDQVLIKFELVKAPSKATLQLKPFLAFRNIHQLTHQNPDANPDATEVPNGASFRLYPNFPDLYLQMNTKEAEYHHTPYWYNGITYSDERRRGFECAEDLMVPGYFEVDMKPGDSVVFSASKTEANPASLKRKFSDIVKKTPEVSNNRDQLVRCADLLINTHNGRKKITAGFSWLYTGLLRESLLSLTGLTLAKDGNTAEFEEILDNLIEDEQERLYRRTTQVEAPLCLAISLQNYVRYCKDNKRMWKKYGPVMKGILESYLPGVRKEVAMQPNGLLWAQMDHVALSWMNAYVNGEPVTERAGFQVETNAFWYNAICFALEMEEKYAGKKDAEFIEKWTAIKNLVKENYQPTFWNARRGCLADYVDANGQNLDTRPNQLYAIAVQNSPVDEELFPSILRIIDNELVTSRGIRTLSPRNVKYKGVYEGTQMERDLAYHQGCTMPFLLMPYVDICFKVKGPSFYKKAEWLLEGFYDDLSKHGVGAFSEIYDGEPPHEPHGAISSALSTSAFLVMDNIMNKYKYKEDK